VGFPEVTIAQVSGMLDLYRATRDELIRIILA